MEITTTQELNITVPFEPQELISKIRLVLARYYSDFEPVERDGQVLLVSGEQEINLSTGACTRGCDYLIECLYCADLVDKRLLRIATFRSTIPDLMAHRELRRSHRIRIEHGSYGAAAVTEDTDSIAGPPNLGKALPPGMSHYAAPDLRRVAGFYDSVSHVESHGPLAILCIADRGHISLVVDAESLEQLMCYCGDSGFEAVIDSVEYELGCVLTFREYGHERKEPSEFWTKVYFERRSAMTAIRERDV